MMKVEEFLRYFSFDFIEKSDILMRFRYFSMIIEIPLDDVGCLVFYMKNDIWHYSIFTWLFPHLNLL